MDILGLLKAQYEKGQPYREALGGLLMGDLQPAKEALGVGKPLIPQGYKLDPQEAFNTAMDWNNPIAGSGLLGVIKNKNLVDAARKHFGITQSPKETGYLIENPITGWTDRLDLSGRHYGAGYEKDYSLRTIPRYKAKSGQPDYLKNTRNVDHRELDDLVPSASPSERMSNFMDESGAIRYFPEVGASLVHTNKPVEKQIKTLVNDFKYSKEPLVIDIDHLNTGQNLASKEFNNPSFEDVMKWIDEQYGLLSTKGD